MTSLPRRIGAVLLTAGLALALACAPGNARAPSAAPPAAPQAPAAAPAAGSPPAPATADRVPLDAPIHLQTLRNLADAALFIAADRGFFEEQGLNVDWETVRSAADTIPALSTGALDAAAGGSSPGLFNAVERGIAVKIVTDKTRLARGGQGSSFLARQDLVDSGEVKGPADFRGRTVSVTTLRSSAGAYLYAALRTAGLTLDDVETVELNPADTLAALANRKIDLAFTFEPMQTLAQQQGLGKPVVWVDEVYPEAISNFLMYSAAFGAERPEAARRFMIAHVKAMRYFWDNYVKGRDVDAVLNVIVDQKAAPSLAVARQMRLSPGDPDGRITADDFAMDQEIYAALGWIDHPVDLQGVIDPTFAQQAVAALGGPYDRN
ncbi:MAG TPA: ABC transporter substrate-binding protein [Chloroflexota bacterium]|nr:ABC transporter substrate-binding protein [Chloroflexota bacterium]